MVVRLVGLHYEAAPKENGGGVLERRQRRRLVCG